MNDSFIDNIHAGLREGLMKNATHGVTLASRGGVDSETVNKPVMRHDILKFYAPIQ